MNVFLRGLAIAGLTLVAALGSESESQAGTTIAAFKGRPQSAADLSCWQDASGAALNNGCTGAKTFNVFLSGLADGSPPTVILKAHVTLPASTSATCQLIQYGYDGSVAYTAASVPITSTGNYTVGSPLYNATEVSTVVTCTLPYLGYFDSVNY